MKDPGCYTHSRNILRARRKPTYKGWFNRVKERCLAHSHRYRAQESNIASIILKRKVLLARNHYPPQPVREPLTCSFSNASATSCWCFLLSASFPIISLLISSSFSSSDEMVAKWAQISDDSLDARTPRCATGRLTGFNYGGRVGKTRYN